MAATQHLDAPDALWTHLENAAKTEERQSNQTCGLIVGDSGVGKSSLVASFLSSSKEDKVKPSVALEYYFARRTNATTGAKDTAHLWELAGGDGAAVELLDVPLSGRGGGFQLKRMAAVVVVVDLAAPQNCISSLRRWLECLRSRIATQIAAAPGAVQEALASRAGMQVPLDHADRRSIDAFPLPLLIAANKYDQFKDSESVPRKTLGLALRYLAHVNGAALVFTSVRERALKENFRAVAGHLLFHLNLRKNNETNPERPLLVAAGADSFDAIQADMTQNVSIGDLTAVPRAADAWERAMEDLFGAPDPEARTEAKDGEDEGTQHREADVDEMKAQKDTELAKYRKDVERKERMRRAQGKSSTSTEGGISGSKRRSAKSSRK